MKTQRLILALVALTFAFTPQSLTTASAARKKEYSAKLISPKAGDVLIPGQVVRVEWTAVYPDVDLTACEMEVLLSVDGGRTFAYVAEQRDATLQYFDWTVPKTPTTTAASTVRRKCVFIGVFSRCSGEHSAHEQI